MNKGIVATCATVLSAVGVHDAMAQNAPATLDESETLADIVVTAQKRVENSQEVPISIAAFSRESLESKAITSVHDLGNFIPNVNLDQSSPFSGSNAVLSASIRGIGQDDFAFNLDPGVGVYIDGVYLGRTVGANQNLLDVERVEVLKGPQGTLFGRNTIGGAISIVTREPSDKFDATLVATGGSFNRRDLAGSVDLPIAPNLLTMITFSSEVHDGYQRRIPYESSTPYVSDPVDAFHAPAYSAADTQGGENQQVARGKFVWMPADRLKITATADWTHEDTSATATSVIEPVTSGPTAVFGEFYNLCIEGVQFVPTAATLCGPRANVGTGLWQANLNPATARLVYSAADSQTGNIDTTYASGMNFTKLDSYGLSGTTVYTASDYLDLKSITGYRSLTWSSGQDQSGSPIPWFYTSAFAEGQHQISEELQAVGKAFDGRLQYLGGLYFFKEAGYIHDFVTFGDGLFQVDGPNSLNTDAYAAFAHLDYKFSEQWSATLGGRYSIENKNFIGGQQELNDFFYKISGLYPVTNANRIALDFPNPANPQQLYPPGVQHLDFDVFTPTAGLQFHPTDDAMVYASYSKGFKSGGWTTRLTQPLAAPIAPTFGPETAITYEIGAKSEWLNHRLMANLAVFDTKYEGIQLQFQEGTSPVTANAGTARIDGVELETQAALGRGLSLNASAGYLHARYIELSPYISGITLDSKLPKTPDFKAAVGPQYELRWSHWSARFNVDYTYTASLYNDTENTPQLRRPSVNSVNSALSFGPVDDRYRITVGGTNLTDQRYLTTGENQSAGGDIIGTYNAPREWYVRLKANL